MSKLKTQLDKAIQNYVDVFCKKHNIEFQYWVADISGTIGFFNDYFFGFEDIRIDIDTEQPENNIFEWYDYTLENEKSCNYLNWIKGFKKAK